MENQVEDDDIILSVALHDECHTALENGDLSPSQYATLFKGIRTFLVSAVKIIKIFPLKCEMLQMLAVLDPKRRYTITNSSVVKLGKTF